MNVLLFCELFLLLLPSTLSSSLPPSTASVSPPYFIVEPRDTFVQPSQQISLYCKGGGNSLGGEVKAIWYNADSNMKIDDYLNSENSFSQSAEILLDPNDPGTLLIPRPHLRYDYRFYCNISYTNVEVIKNVGISPWNRSAVVQAGIAYLDQEFVSPPVTAESVEGGDVHFQCEGPLGLPSATIQWECQNKLFSANKTDQQQQQDGRYHVFANSLYIRSVRASDAGMCICIASNSIATRRSVEARLIVLPASPLNIFKEQITVKQNSNVSFHCTSQESIVNSTLLPTPPSSSSSSDATSTTTTATTVRWILPHTTGFTDSIGQSRLSYHRSHIYLSNVQMKDAGTYHCVAGAYNRSWSLRVEAPPAMLKTPEDLTLRVGDSLILHCQASGLPEPEIYWELPQGELFPEDMLEGGRIRMMDNGSLWVTSVKEMDTGKYICNAHNPHGNTRASAIITILNEVGGQTYDLRRQLHPVILFGPSNETVRAGSTMHLSCEVDPYSATTIELQWLFNPQPQSQPQSINLHNPRFLILHNSILQIADVSESDSGEYICRATAVDSGLQTTWSAFLNVTRLSSAFNPSLINSDSRWSVVIPSVTRLDVGEVTEDSVHLQWQINNQQTSTTFSRLHYQLEMEEVNSVPSSSSSSSSEGWRVIQSDVIQQEVTVTQLKPQTAYRFLVRPRLMDSGYFGRSSSPTPITVTQSVNSNQIKKKWDLPTVVDFMREVYITRVRLSSLSGGRVRVDWDTTSTSKEALDAVGSYRVEARILPMERCLSDFSSWQAHYCNLPKNPSTKRLRDVLNWFKTPSSSSSSSSSTDVIPYKHVARRDHVVGGVELRYDGGQSLRESTSLDQLKAFACYSVEVEALSRETELGPMSGAHSGPNTLLLTEEALPSAAPHIRNVTWINNNTICINWHLEHLRGIHSKLNGILTGLVLHLITNNSQQRVELTNIQEDDCSLVKGVNSTHTYTLYAAAVNCRGEGARSPAYFLISPHNDQATDMPSSSSWWTSSWWRLPLLILVIAVVWTLVCVTSISALCNRRCHTCVKSAGTKWSAPPDDHHHHHHHHHHHRNSLPQSKLNNPLMFQSELPPSGSRQGLLAHHFDPNTRTDTLDPNIMSTPIDPIVIDMPHLTDSAERVWTGPPPLHYPPPDPQQQQQQQQQQQRSHPTTLASFYDSPDVICDEDSPYAMYVGLGARSTMPFNASTMSTGLVYTSLSIPDQTTLSNQPTLPINHHKNTAAQNGFFIPPPPDTPPPPVPTRSDRSQQQQQRDRHSRESESQCNSNSTKSTTSDSLSKHHWPYPDMELLPDSHHHHHHHNHNHQLQQQQQLRGGPPPYRAVGGGDRSADELRQFYEHNGSDGQATTHV